MAAITYEVAHAGVLTMISRTMATPPDKWELLKLDTRLRFYAAALSIGCHVEYEHRSEWAKLIGTTARLHAWVRRPF